MHIFLALFLSITSIYAKTLSCDISPSSTKPSSIRIKIIDQKALDLDDITGIPFSEISDLAYDADHKKLYMVSDKGRLFVFGATFGDHNMSIEPIGGYYLHSKSNKYLKRKNRDSEGLAFDGEGHLWVSFEHRPRIAQISTNGKILSYGRLPGSLLTLGKMRGGNKGLESLTWHPRHGLVAAIEYPPRKTPLTRQTLYSLSGRIWHFRVDDIPHIAVTAIETMDDGSILVLLRSYDKRSIRFIVELIKVHLNRCKNRVCDTKVLAKLSTDDGWALDNFEGLTRISTHRYLMASDNGGPIPRSTLLIYFEVIPDS